MNPLTVTAASNGHSPEAAAPAVVERLVPERMAGRVIHAEHVARYAWAASLAGGRAVLDAGCGAGYGAQMLAGGAAERVVGVDISEEAVVQARAHAPGLEFITGDVQQLPFPDGSFDLVVCFEVLEHLQDPEGAVRELRRVLRPAAPALVSTPNVEVHPPGNNHHVKELTPNGLALLLRTSFASVRLERQHLWAASLIGDESVQSVSDPAVVAAASVRKLSGRAPGRETYTLAVASDGPLPDIEPVAMLADTYEIRLWQERLDELREEMRAAHHELEATRAREALVDLSARRMTGALEELSAENAELHRARADRDRAQHDAEVLARRLDVTEFWLETIQSSISWQSTRPPRAVMRLIRRLARRTDPAALRVPR